MIAYKAFNKDMTCTLGKGIFQYSAGETIKEDKSKCASTGLHCAENPLDCFSYYSPEKNNRYFQVEAAGSIDEDGYDTKIACTEMTLLKEMTLKQMAGFGMVYIVQHPMREWEKNGNGIDVKKEKAEAIRKESIAIARGKNPKVRGAKGSILGLIYEPKLGDIEAAKIFEVKEDIKENTWYTLEDGNLKEVEVDET